MTSYALQVLADDPGHFRWALLNVDGERVLTERMATREFDCYESALNAGTLVLAAADQQPYENEAAEPVRNSECNWDPDCDC